MKNIEKAMGSISGTVFLYCSLKDEKSISFFTSAAEHTGRRLLLAVFYALENVRHIQNTAQLNDWNFYGTCQT